MQILNTTVPSLISVIGDIVTIVFVIGLICGWYAWFKGILRPLIRLGNGFSKRKIVIFAKGDNLRSLEDLLLDTKLFKRKNLTGISSDGDFGRIEKATLFLIFWPDWKDNITEILNIIKSNSMLIVYVPQEVEFISKDKMRGLNKKANVSVVNLRGRLLNDVIISLISTNYQ